MDLVQISPVPHQVMLAQLEQELAEVDARHRSLATVVAGLRQIVEGVPLPPDPKPAPRAIPVPPGHFKDMTVTGAYRELLRLWPDDYKPTQIADALTAGGIEMGRTPLLQSVHSVRRREKAKGSKAGRVIE